jgi:hypothetical protein
MNCYCTNSYHRMNDPCKWRHAWALGRQKCVLQSDKCSILNSTGTHADLLITVFHKIITTGHQRLQPLFDCLLTILVNGKYHQQRLQCYSTVSMERTVKELLLIIKSSSWKSHVCCSLSQECAFNILDQLLSFLIAAVTVKSNVMIL